MENAEDLIGQQSDPGMWIIAAISKETTAGELIQRLSRLPALAPVSISYAVADDHETRIPVVVTDFIPHYPSIDVLTFEDVQRAWVESLRRPLDDEKTQGMRCPCCGSD